MKTHLVYFYGSTKIVSGHNSLKPGSLRKRNQIIGFEGIDVNPELVEYGEICFNKLNDDGTRGETGTMYPKNITIVPFEYLYPEHSIIRHLEDVITANERFIKAENIEFPLMRLREATNEGLGLLGEGHDRLSIQNRDAERKIRDTMCCFGHRYIDLLNRALTNKGYTSPYINPNEKCAMLQDTSFTKNDGTRININANAGL
jgi:hypothetical protein